MIITHFAVAFTQEVGHFLICFHYTKTSGTINVNINAKKNIVYHTSYRHTHRKQQKNKKMVITLLQHIA